MQPGQYAPPPRQAQKFPVWIIVIIVVVVGAVFFVGILAALGIYGTRRYIGAAKTAEAKNTIGAVARGAMASYERETGDPAAPHKLCGTAVPVPAAVPAGTKYMPGVSAGSDFNTGDSEKGWMCLKFSMSQPMYYQYNYHQGSGYLGPAAQSPGPTGFEAAARGDLDGNGKTSLFVLTGTVAGGAVSVSPTMFIDNEME